MDYLPYSQEFAALVSVMAGMLLGFMWDSYRIIRHYAKLNTFGTVVGDILYWIISIYISARLILDISSGNVRFFILVGFLSGALLYFYGISKGILKLSIFIIDFILKVFKHIIRILIGPFKFLFNKIIYLMSPLKIIYIKNREIFRKRYKFLKFKLKKVFKNKKILYNKKRREKKLRRKFKRKRSSRRRQV